VTILRGTAIPDLIGSEGYGSINGTITHVARIGAAVAPIAIVLAWDKFGKYGPAVWGLFALAVVGAVSYGVAICAACDANGLVPLLAAVPVISAFRVWRRA
jgi:hypothetical protein